MRATPDSRAPSDDGLHAVLVHGVGFGAACFDAVAEQLLGHGITPLLVTRRGYDGRDATADLDRHVDDLAVMLDGIGSGPVVVAGVSGGATLVLALALRGHPRLDAVVVHESLLGPVAVEQHRVIGNSIRAFVDGDTSMASFLETLVTPGTFSTMPEHLVRNALGCEATSRIEAPGFARFTVEACELRSATVPIVWTIGARSPSWRRAAADIAVANGCHLEVLDAAHMPHLEDPSGLVRSIRTAGTAP